MNLEILLKLLIQKKQLIKKKKHIKKLILYFNELKKKKTNLLKTGKITFLINEPNANEYRFITEIEIKYSNNDVYLNKSKDLQKMIEKFEWKWDLHNILSFLLIFIFFIFQLYFMIFQWYCQYIKLPSSILIIYNQLNVFIIKNIFFQNIFTHIQFYNIINLQLIDVFIDIIIKFNFLL